MVGIEEELFGNIVIGTHPLVANNGQLLLFDRFKPGNMEMSMYVIRKLEIRMNRVRNALLEMSLGSYLYTRWLAISQALNDGNVMRGKAPEYIFLMADFAKIETGGTEMLEFAELVACQEFLYFQNGRVVFENVTNHKNTLLCKS
jgi:hypothetical protein